MTTKRVSGILSSPTIGLILCFFPKMAVLIHCVGFTHQDTFYVHHKGKSGKNKNNFGRTKTPTGGDIIQKIAQMKSIKSKMQCKSPNLMRPKAKLFNE